MQLGIYSFGEMTPDPKTGRTIGARERLRRLVEEIELADRLGLDVFGVGEHHRAEFVVSTPAVALAIIGGEPRRFVPLIQLYREAARRSGHDPATLAVSINSHGLIEDDSRQAAEDAFAAYSYVMAKIGRERGWAPLTRQQFEAERAPHGANLIGTPDEVAAKILYEHELFGLDRFLMQMSVGTLPHEKVLRSIELFATKVAPLVRAEVARRTATPAPAPA